MATKALPHLMCLPVRPSCPPLAFSPSPAVSQPHHRACTLPRKDFHDRAPQRVLVSQHRPASSDASSEPHLRLLSLALRRHLSSPLPSPPPGYTFQFLSVPVPAQDGSRAGPWNKTAELHLAALHRLFPDLHYRILRGHCHREKGTRGRSREGPRWAQSNQTAGFQGTGGTKGQTQRQEVRETGHIYWEQMSRRLKTARVKSQDKG